MKKRSVTRWKGAEAVARARARAEEGEAFQGPINEWAPRGRRNGPNQPNSPIPGPSLRLVLCNARDARIN